MSLLNKKGFLNYKGYTQIREGQKCTGNEGTLENVQIREIFQIGEVSNKRWFTVVQ